MADNLTANVLIVGAGLCGMMAGHVLSERGLRVVLLEKDERVGGRLATERVGSGIADAGAQFFTVRDAAFGAYAERWQSIGLVFEWSQGWNDGSLSVNHDGHPRYAVREGFAALATHLARGLDVRLNVDLSAVNQTKDGWQAVDRLGRHYNAKAIILTPPVPQAFALLDEGKVRLSESDRAALNRIEYAPSLTALFQIDGPGLPAPGGVQRPDANLRWIADNKTKGISPKAVILTVQASQTYSRQLWSVPDDEVLRAFRVDVLPFLHDTAKIADIRLLRWPYAEPTVLHPDHCLIAQGVPPLVVAGDAFREARVEGAALSGLAAGRAISDALK
jgi:renalase